MRVIDIEHDSNSEPISVICEYDGNIYEFETVRHGRWVDNTKLIHGFLDHQFNCSECDYVNWNPTVGLHYCPNCGAKMDGGAKDACDPQNPENAG